MKTSRPTFGPAWGVAALLGYVAAVFLTPAHLLEEHHVFLAGPAVDFHPVQEHEHGHHHDEPSHDPHAAADHELVAVSPHDESPADFLVQAVLLERPLGLTTREICRIPAPRANGPPDRSDQGCTPSRAPPLL